jgi:elongation factor P
MALTDQPRKDMYVMMDGRAFYILDRMYKTQGRQGGLLILKLKNLETGNNSTVTLKAGAKVDVFEPEVKEVQYLYKDAEYGYFMDTESFETIPMANSVIGDYLNYLKEGDKTLITIFEGKILDVRRKATVTLLITSTQDAVKGNTSGNAMKSATVETGYTLNVPMFVNQGDVITINTETGEYSGRVNG